MAQVKWKDYTIEVWVEMYDPEDDEDVTYFETTKEARDYKKIWPAYKDYDIRWCAAEIINERGDLNPSVSGETRKEALDKLKKILKAA